MVQIIAVSNQKGGVGKTTSAISLSCELALAGKSVLLVDFDPQGSATSGIGIEIEEDTKDLYDVFFSNTSISDIIKKTQIEGLFIAPASKDLVSLEIEIGKKPGRELILKTELSLLRQSYDYILIDCPPSSGLLTLNALGAATKIIIPLQAEYYALEGLSALMNTITFVQNTFNPGLEIAGVFMTMFDVRTNLSLMVEKEAKEYFKSLMFNTRVPRNIKLSEAPSHGLPICLYDPSSAGAKAYKELALELIYRLEPDLKVVANG